MALFFNELICSADDVKILKDKKIIVDHTKMTDEELQEFFSTMSFGVDCTIVGQGYDEMVDELSWVTLVTLAITMSQCLCFSLFHKHCDIVIDQCH